MHVSAGPVTIEPVGFVEAPRLHAEDDFWGGEQACITLQSSSTELMSQYWLKK